MNILLINGTKRKQSTYHVAKQFIAELKGEHEIKEIFLPDAMPSFCLGCGKCFLSNEKNCPHYQYSNAFIQQVEWADLLVFASPVFVYHVTGQLKSLLDHFGYCWLIHRPKRTMFKKQAVVLSTAAGGGMKSTCQDVIDSLNNWGVARSYKYGKAVRGTNWDAISPKIKKEINCDLKKLAKKIELNPAIVKPSLKIKMYFYFYRWLVKKINLKNDVDYWQKNDLFEKKPF